MLSTLCRILNIAIACIICCSFLAIAKQDVTAVQLAEVYTNQNIQHYLVSEKFDGIRAIWKHKQLRTRTGHLIHAPKWFTDKLPDVWLDGELWFERSNFEYVASTVSKDIPVNREWEKIKYMIFDAPNYTLDFQNRAAFYTELLNTLQLDHVHAVEQLVLANNEDLVSLLESYTLAGAEGLMLHKANALFTSGRGYNVLKVKKFMDAEALVIQHLPGKGKYVNMLGALLVQYETTQGNSLQFKVGTGFSDKERGNPPPLGSIITFQYHGFTKRGLPRFASFMRVRKND